jgi:chromosome segregation ATPase
MSARAAAKRPAGNLPSLGSNNVSSTSEDADEDDAKAETVAVIEDLKNRLGKADAAAEEYQRQLEVVQSRLDDALNEQARLEEVVHESSEKIEALENGKRDAQRQARELESIYEAERVAIMQEKEEMVGREEELHSVIQRLKDSLTQRDMRTDWNDSGISRTCTVLNGFLYQNTPLTISFRSE